MIIISLDSPAISLPRMETHEMVGREVRAAIAKIGVAMPENIPAAVQPVTHKNRAAYQIQYVATYLLANGVAEIEKYRLPN